MLWGRAGPRLVAGSKRAPRLRLGCTLLPSHLAHPRHPRSGARARTPSGSRTRPYLAASGWCFRFSGGADGLTPSGLARGLACRRPGCRRFGECDQRPSWAPAWAGSAGRGCGSGLPGVPGSRGCQKAVVLPPRFTWKGRRRPGSGSGAGKGSRPVSHLQSWAGPAGRRLEVHNNPGEVCSCLISREMSPLPSPAAGRQKYLLPGKHRRSP